MNTYHSAATFQKLHSMTYRFTTIPPGHKTEDRERPKIIQIICSLKSVEESNRPFYQVETETKQ